MPLQIIVTVNNGLSPASKRIDLRLFSTLGEVKVTQTSVNETNISEKNVSIDDQKMLHIQTAPESITTAVISNINLPESSTSNLIVNGDFESQNPAEIAKWNLELGVNGSGGLSSQFPWRGNTSGFLGTSEGNSGTRRLTQVVKVPKDSQTFYQLFLTAWCSTTGIDTKLSLNVFSRGVSKETIVSGGPEGYRMYYLALKVKGGDEVKVQFDSFSGESYLDNVSLHFVEVQPDLEDEGSGGISKTINITLFFAIVVVIVSFAFN